MANPGLSQMFEGDGLQNDKQQESHLGAASQKIEDLIFLKELIEAGKIRRSSIDAIRWNRLPRRTGMSKQGSKKGNVVITVETQQQHLQSTD